MSADMWTTAEQGGEVENRDSPGSGFELLLPGAGEIPQSHQSLTLLNPSLATGFS